MSMMNGQSIGPAGMPMPVPPKIETAMRYLNFAQSVNWGPGGLSSIPGDGGLGRDLTIQEKRVYDAALATLLEYFNTDGFGDVGQTQPPEPPDDGLKQPVEQP